MVTTSEHMKKKMQDGLTKIHVRPYVERFKATQSALTMGDTRHNRHKQHLDADWTWVEDPSSKRWPMTGQK